MRELNSYRNSIFIRFKDFQNVRNAFLSACMSHILSESKKLIFLIFFLFNNYLCNKKVRIK